MVIIYKVSEVCLARFCISPTRGGRVRSLDELVS